MRLPLPADEPLGYGRIPGQPHRKFCFAQNSEAICGSLRGLRERELIKLASLASALAGALRRRGVTEPAASLAAEAGIAVFRLAFERWINDTSQADLPQFIRESLDELKAVTAGQ